MRVLHTSDLHGRYKALLGFDEPFDVWIDTGDFFPNKGRKCGSRIDPQVERDYQVRWTRYKSIGARIADWLKGRPMLTVPGNHDFISLHTAVKGMGGDAHLVTPGGVKLLGYQWAGYRHIPYIDGEWPGEVEAWEFEELTRGALNGADFLVTHAPPSGILSGTPAKMYGVSAITTSLAYREHQIRAHFFGHEHSDGGKVTEEMGVRFINGACNLRVHDISDLMKD